MEEKFRKIDGYENYSVSNTGQVRNDVTGKFLKPDIRRGYKYICLCNCKQYKKFNIHRLVATAFVDNPDNKPYVDHIDGNKINNNTSNLRWVTNQQNQMNMKLPKDNTSSVKGVRFENGKWRARIFINGKSIHIGVFNTLEEAALARRRVAEQNFSEYMNACEKAPIININ